MTDPAKEPAPAKAPAPVDAPEPAEAPDPVKAPAPTEAPEPAEATLTSEERLRLLTNDRKRKTRPGSSSGKHVHVPATKPGDLVDAVRERSNLDLGRDTPL